MDLYKVARAPKIGLKGFIKSCDTYPAGIYETFAQHEVCVWQVGEGLQQDLGCHCSLIESWVKLVPASCK